MVGRVKTRTWLRKQIRGLRTDSRLRWGTTISNGMVDRLVKLYQIGVSIGNEQFKKLIPDYFSGDADKNADRN